MKAKDIMTMPVFTVAPDTPVLDIAGLLLERQISAVPVVEDGRVVGLVSEGDLLHRREIGTDGSLPEASWWNRLLKDDPAPAAYVKSHATRASDVMTRNVVSVVEETSIAEIAALFEARKIKRVPVLRRKKLVGIVSRVDFVQLLAEKAKTSRTHCERSDDQIRKQLLSELANQSWWRQHSSNVLVTGGVVQYWGVLRSDDERQAARVAAENVPGVCKVEDHWMRLADLPSML